MDLDQASGFDWDSGNARKSAEKYDVTRIEADKVFFNEPLLLLEDGLHSDAESRFCALGRTNLDRLIHLTFTLRQDGALIRIISARPLSRKIYEDA
jgi:uncharacterized protein